MTTPQPVVVECSGQGPIPAGDNAGHRAAAGALVDGGLIAVPAVPDTGAHPVWSLRHLEIDGLRGQWCRTVQGRGGAFGADGSCRFAFFDDTLPAIAAWHPATAAPSADAVYLVLAGLVLDQPMIRVDGTPEQAAAVIGAVLSVLPRRVAMSRV